MLPHTSRPTSRVSFNASLFLALLLAAFAGLTSLTRQTRAVVAPSPETVVAKFAPAAHATPTPWPTAAKCITSRWSAEGNLNDSNGIAPGLNPGGWVNGAATFGPGATGQSFRLDGIDDYVEAATTPAGMNSPASFTWEACVYPLDLTNRVPVVFSKTATVSNRAGLQINSNGSLCSYMNSSSCAQISGAGSVATNKWTKVTMIYNGATQKLITYVDGLQIPNPPPTIGVPYNHSTTPAAKFTIGYSSIGGGNKYFYGFIDEVSFSTCVVPPTTTPCACGATPSPTPTPIP